MGWLVIFCFIVVILAMFNKWNKIRYHIPEPDWENICFSDSHFCTKQCPDGIANAEDVIVKAGGIISKEFIISWPQGVPMSELANDAIWFLIDEWDYNFQSRN
jgi:hypothetical protein